MSKTLPHACAHHNNSLQGKRLAATQPYFVRETGVSEARPSLTLYFTDSENLCQYLKGSCLLDDEYRPVDWSSLGFTSRALGG